MRRFSLRSLVLATLLVFVTVSSSSAQTLRDAAAHAGTDAALAAQGGSGGGYNKPLLYSGSALFGAGIGLVISGLVNSADCNDLDGFGLIGEIYEDECNDASMRRYLFGAAFASGGTALMLLARPRVANAMPSVSFGPGRATVRKTVTF